ncbi:MAG: flagellar biosynthetic protein FliR [Treponema sp.]|nr:flagellar biosynthetic protein FliR [Treponema sp.]
MLEQIVAKAPLYFLIAARVFAMILTVPLLSTAAVSRVAKIALAGYTAYILMSQISYSVWNVDPYSLDYVLLVIGEGLIGIITGFYVSMLFAAFSSAGQFFTYQMGFGASEVYDSLSQIENPLMGQYLNLLAMLLFLQVKGFQKLFLGGVLRSFESLNCYVLLEAKNTFLTFLLSGLTKLFFDAMMIALPIIGTLFLISISTGLLSKAAPQMNLLSEGLPTTILCAFFLLTVLLPSMCNYFERCFTAAFVRLEDLFAKISPLVAPL